VTAEGDGPAIIMDHPYTPPEDPNRHLCAHCNLGEAAHAATLRPFPLTGRRAPRG